MAERITSLTRHSARNVPYKYPWKSWMDGGVWRIKQHQDFSCTIFNMRTRLYQQAGDKGLKISVHLHGQHIEFQFLTFGRQVFGRGLTCIEMDHAELENANHGVTAIAAARTAEMNRSRFSVVPVAAAVPINRLFESMISASLDRVSRMGSGESAACSDRI